jgi:hypothetical protein
LCSSSVCRLVFTITQEEDEKKKRKEAEEKEPGQ